MVLVIDPSDGLHDTPLKIIINWNTAPMIMMMMMMMMNLIIIIIITIIII